MVDNEMARLAKESLAGMLEGLRGMRRYEDRVFEKEHVVLDDGIFINCTFKDSTIEYSGGDVYFYNGFSVQNSPLIWRGAAMRTLGVLNMFQMLKPPDQASIVTATQMPGKVN